MNERREADIRKVGRWLTWQQVESRTGYSRNILQNRAWEILDRRYPSHTSIEIEECLKTDGVGFPLGGFEFFILRLGRNFKIKFRER